MKAWDDAPAPADPAIGPGGWVLAVARGVPLASVTFGGLALLLAVRMVERPLFGQRRPVTPYITQFVCRSAFAILGMRRRVRGRFLKRDGAVVSNHASWLDIFALNASKRIYFVAKDEVSGWPGIGWLARATGTMFIRRDRREAAAQTRIFEERLHHGHHLLFFPEGTSTDGRRVLPFKTTLFAAFFSDALREDMHIQPVSLIYHAPPGADPAFYGWWGEMSFAGHMLRMLAAPRHGAVEVVYHPPLAVADFADRKALARAAETAVRTGLRNAGIDG
ncbi:lysophospholipid acyltransferase family protein [Jannaschia aquimarina]|uniref:2-acyl-glycerophospho-ethanolamine acyltransferase n=1 Tax=Jannaschia aquimarina TaxID=935700 RepID=A0A0D1ELF8_9RHOB|nr:lysophospholipid acyltransferase family protein [Jannaschia aquimarina]KIT17786.1 2-acyl-glycerophospho-ethanolamine acyltransferase [Jannaschia aquimarina]SNT14338.1 lyso-ornithine lipid acyltransferase [Jannaschia aquimarina]